MNLTLIWLTCVAVAWSSSGGSVAGYHVEVGGALQADVATADAVACVPDLYTSTVVRVQAFDDDGNSSEWSGPLDLTRVHNFDCDGNGAAGFNEYGQFLQAFGKPVPWVDPLDATIVCDFDADQDGVVGFGDFGRFIQAFGLYYKASGIAERTP